MNLRDRIVELRRVPASELIPHEHNWRRHPAAQRDALRGVLREIGFAGAILARQTQEGLQVIDGHLRQDLTRDAVVPVLVTDLTEEEADKLLVTYDPLGAMAQADQDALLTLLGSLQFQDRAVNAMLETLAHGEARPLPPLHEDPGPQIGRAAELQEQWGTALEQLWEVPSRSVPGRAHRLLCGDSTRPQDVDRLMMGERAGLMATDPPYLVNYQGGNHPQSWANRGSPKRDKHWDDYREGDGPGFFLAFLRAALAEALTENPAVYQWHATKRQRLVEEAWTEAGLLWHQTIIWAKARPVLTHAHYLWSHEPCAYGWVEGNPPKLRPPATERTVWEVDKQGEEEGLHPTQKPVELFARPLQYHLERGGLCYEPFAGSGTGLVAAEQAGRVCYALELAPEYVAACLERLAGLGLEPRACPP